MRREFTYPINNRPLRVSKRATQAGERAFNRPADITKRKTQKELVAR